MSDGESEALGEVGRSLARCARASRIRAAPARDLRFRTRRWPRAAAITFAREEADVLVSYLSEYEDAPETVRCIEKAGERALAVSGDVPARPAELAPAYVQLASCEASYMTGAALPVTGGGPML